jgi:anti-sigma regulatory factor (Ser/Thr protein kinase)
MGNPDRFALVLAPDPANLPIVRHALRGFLEAGGTAGDTIGDILLAVTEACANVVQHAYAGVEPPGKLHLTAQRQGDEVLIAVRDHGRGFAPRPDSPGAGLGLPVIASLTERVEIRPVPESGTEVVMAFAPEATA